jgi:hypothetical protein
MPKQRERYLYIFFLISSIYLFARKEQFEMFVINVFSINFDKK